MCTFFPYTTLFRSEVVVNGVGLGATDAQIMKQLVEDGRQLLGLLFAIVSAGKRVLHRLGLVDQKQETARVLTTDFGLVCHGFSPERARAARRRYAVTES